MSEIKSLHFTWEYTALFFMLSILFYMVSFVFIFEKGQGKKILLNEIHTLMRSIFTIFVGFYIITFFTSVKVTFAKPYFDNPKNIEKQPSDLHKALIKNTYN